MKQLEVIFDKSVGINSHKVLFETKKQIVFVGRSNVGKSSIMNAIFMKKNLVKTSSLPGKTKTANLFKVNNKFHFVDLPGYGFAKLGQLEKEKLDSLISWYLEEFKFDIKKIVVVLDCKLGPTNVDIDMYKFLSEFQIPVIFVLNKSDKLGKNEINKSEIYTKKIFFGQQVLSVSAKKGTGINELRKELMNSLKK